MIKAFADSHWHVVLPIGKHTAPSAVGPVPANVEIASYVPQLAVPRHASAFITHAGMSSVMESPHYQVPMVAIPRVHEQAVNAGRVYELGLGLRLDSPAATPAQPRR